jgi:hypothetical protein
MFVFGAAFLFWAYRRQQPPQPLPDAGRTR